MQIRVVKEKIEASKGEEYYADGLKLIYSGLYPQYYTYNSAAFNIASSSI